ncbi:type II secretion system protein GspM [Pseudomarimonas arenosa]|uniref:Type II secretion system protein M n=1 Tax=Pseudomarimonas arenosa TaxID=2774145 RepID=A0AAW3ZHH6_9GAMM|nr:type II secretion system protein GspM [Pseudomarimonas arenosa]MBD8525555.1 type II secretion system protein M [Pseudomarimonas arenosa]
MIGWWQNLSERDQRMLRWGGFLALALLLYGALWIPLGRDRDAWRTRAEAADSAWAFMRDALANGPIAASPSAHGDNRSLLARIDSGAREAGLGGVLLRVEPVNQRQVRVYFQGAPFDRLMEWLQPTAQRYQIRVEELSIRRSEGVGLVEARLTLSEPG